MGMASPESSLGGGVRNISSIRKLLHSVCGYSGKRVLQLALPFSVAKGSQDLSMNVLFVVQVPPATNKGKGRQRDILEATAILGEISSFLCSISKDQKNVVWAVFLLIPICCWSCFLTVFHFLMFTEFFIFCVLLRFFFLQQRNYKYAVIVKCADFVFLSTLGHLFTPSSLEAGLSRCNCFSLAHYSVSIMASSRGTTWSTVLNTQPIGAPTSDLHQVITAAGFPRSNLQAICHCFELHPNLHWTCESDQLWWKSAWKLPAGPDKTTECVVTFILARKPPLEDYEVGYWSTDSSHQPCFSMPLEQECAIAQPDVHQTVALCKGNLCLFFFSLPRRCALNAAILTDRAQSPSINGAIETKGSFFLS